MKNNKIKRNYKSSKYTAQSWEENYNNSGQRTNGFITTKDKSKYKKAGKNTVLMDELADKLKTKSYQYFLKSEYWEIIRDMVLKRDKYKCKKCVATYKLQVHHKTYENHFREHNHLKDLVTLCESCHKKEHAKKIIK